MIDEETMQRLLNSIEPVSLFVTLNTREEADEWIGNQPQDLPNAVAFMAGYNYALRQVQRIISG